MRYRCKCLPPPKGFVFEANAPICPKCGRHGNGIHELVDIHFMVLHPAGPIMGEFGRQYVACQPKREYLATHEGDHFSATDDPRVVNCRSCRGTQAWKDMAKLFPEIAREEELAKAMQALGIGVHPIPGTEDCGDCPK